jgi:hypothetical protein
MRQGLPHWAVQLTTGPLAPRLDGLGNLGLLEVGDRQATFINLTGTPVSAFTTQPRYGAERGTT